MTFFPPQPKPTFPPPPWRVLVCGDREWDDAYLIRTTIQRLMLLGTIECIIEGEARGADRLAARMATALGFRQDQILRYPAQWQKYGRAAGPVRNRQMMTEGHPNIVLAFHDNTANSKGTKDMLTVAAAAGVWRALVSHANPEVNWK